MAKADYTQLAKEVVAAVGGKENIVNVTNCMTRLRFVLKDDSIPDKDKVAGIKGVKGVMNQGGQYQVIIGTHVSEVVKDVRREAQISGEGSINKEDMKLIKKDSLWNRFFKTISGCIMPMLGPMIAGGIIKGILVILVTAGILTKTDGTYLVLYAAGDAILYFMPVIVGFTCGKVFDCNPYVTAVIGAAFLYPDLVSAVSAEGGITFLKIPVAAASYTNTFLPIVLASFVASKLEKLAKKFIPSMLQLMLVPTFVLAVTVPLSWIVIGPVMNTVSSWLSKGVFGIFGMSPLLGGTLLGAFWQLVVLLGLHAAFIPILMNNLFSQGYDPVNAVLGLTVWALAGVTLGYALKNKDPEKRGIGFGSLASALCGVTEPAIYSIALPNFKLFVCAWIGGGISGGILGALGGKMYTMAGDGLFRIPAMINPEGLDISFYGFIICALISFAVSAVLAFIMADSGVEEAEQVAEQMDTDMNNHVLEENKMISDNKETIIYAPVSGKVICREDIPDETFASGIMGEGVGIKPEEEIIVAPFDGEITSVVDTGHAVGLTSFDGVELLIHVGVDTVKMQGDGFQVFVTEGQKVKTGEKLLKFDRDKIRKAGYSDTTAVLVTNSDDYSSVKTVAENVKQKDTVIIIEK
ncbi:MAG: PTS glucose transporter subunit IIA [Lachnospiraceae bacterium]|nr:PTS glucose transporter subunit IIA [Lachnospiraceae bacterium]